MSSQQIAHENRRQGGGVFVTERSARPVVGDPSLSHCERQGHFLIKEKMDRMQNQNRH